MFNLWSEQLLAILPVLTVFRSLYFISKIGCSRIILLEFSRFLHCLVIKVRLLLSCATAFIYYHAFFFLSTPFLIFFYFFHRNFQLGFFEDFSHFTRYPQCTRDTRRQPPKDGTWSVCPLCTLRVSFFNQQTPNYTDQYTSQGSRRNAQRIPKVRRNRSNQEVFHSPPA